MIVHSHEIASDLMTCQHTGCNAPATVCQHEVVYIGCRTQVWYWYNCREHAAMVEVLA